MRAQWDSRFPDPVELRRETEAVTRACIDTLLEAIPRGEIESITLKGSAIKQWDTPIDYVPELSDVDIHILFTDDDAARRLLDPVAQGLRIQARTEQLFSKTIPAPFHFPRVQLTVANALYQQPDYVPSPPGTEIVVVGHEPSGRAVDPEIARERSRRQLLDATSYLATLGQHVAEKPGKHLWPLARAMSWRISPTGPRVLELLGTPYAQTWRLNRTAVIQRLEEVGERDLARDYSSFYLSAWKYFLSGHWSNEAVRRAVEVGARVLERGVEVAQDQTYLPPHQ